MEASNAFVSQDTNSHQVGHVPMSMNVRAMFALKVPFAGIPSGHILASVSKASRRNITLAWTLTSVKNTAVTIYANMIVSITMEPIVVSVILVTRWEAITEPVTISMSVKCTKASTCAWASV